MRAIFYIWGFFGFILCGINTFAVAAGTGVQVQTMLGTIALTIMWLSGLVLFGLAAVLSYLEWKPEMKQNA